MLTALILSTFLVQQPPQPSADELGLKLNICMGTQDQLIKGIVQLQTENKRISDVLDKAKTQVEAIQKKVEELMKECGVACKDTTTEYGKRLTPGATVINKEP